MGPPPLPWIAKDAFRNKNKIKKFTKNATSSATECACLPRDKLAPAPKAQRIAKCHRGANIKKNEKRIVSIAHTTVKIFSAPESSTLKKRTRE